MNEIFPLFLQDTDGLMHMIHSESDLNFYLEIIDIEDSEYKAWDKDGQPYLLFVNKTGKIAAQKSSDEKNTTELKHALKNFFLSKKVSVPVSIPLDIVLMKEKFLQANKK